MQKRAAITAYDLDGSKSDRNGTIETGVVAEQAFVPESVDDTLRDIVTDAVSEANLLTNVGTEMSFQLPLGASSNFKPMFEALDREVEQGTIETYGVSITTLEEVFLLVARGAETAASKKNLASSQRLSGVPVIEDGKADKSDLDGRSQRSKMNLERNRLFATHLQALFKKRAINFKRDKKAWCCTTILPSIFVLIGFLISKFAAPNRNLTALKLDLNDYNINVKSGPRNPIPFNANGTHFTCQPGTCSYPVTQLDTLFTGETYQFCGTLVQALLQNGSHLPSCSISESSSFVDKITAFGASPIPLNASDVKTVGYTFSSLPFSLL